MGFLVMKMSLLMLLTTLGIGFIATVVGVMAVFEKAGEKDYYALIPIYNLYVWTKISDVSKILLFPLLIPYINIVVAFYVNTRLSKHFFDSSLKSNLAGFFGTLLPFVLFPYLGFSNKDYQNFRPN